MAGKDSDDQTNLQLFKVGRSGRIAVAGEDDAKNKDAAAFKHLMAKMQEEARPVGYLFGKGALDHDDLVYLKEQNQAEEDAHRQRELNERRAFAAFKAAASAADLAPPRTLLAPGSAPTPSAPASPRLQLKPRTRTGIRQSELVQSIVAVRPKKKGQGLLRPDSGGANAEADDLYLGSRKKVRQDWSTAAAAVPDARARVVNHDSALHDADRSSSSVTTGLSPACPVPATGAAGPLQEMHTHVHQATPGVPSTSPGAAQASAPPETWTDSQLTGPITTGPRTGAQGPPSGPASLMVASTGGRHKEDASTRDGLGVGEHESGVLGKSLSGQGALLGLAYDDSEDENDT